MPRMQADSIPDVLWQRLGEFVAQNTGLHFPPERWPDLQRSLTAAATEFGFADSHSCIDWLLSAPLTRVQLHILANHLTIGETYFFRERKTFDALAERILPDLLRRRRGGEQRLRLWSAACSTGEEPYSLAILVRQQLPDWRDWHITILATDINERSLQIAAAGVYKEWSFRESPPGFKERYFTRTSDGRFALVPEIRNCVSFAHMNLARDSFPSLSTNTNAMDVIFCRNVLIYFTPAHARELVENLRHALTDEGWLAVSPSECSQALFSNFAAVNFPDSILYRKSRVEEQNAAAWTRASPATEVQYVPQECEALPLSEPEVTNVVRMEGPPAEPMEASSSELSRTCATAESFYSKGLYAEAASTLVTLFNQEAAQTASGARAFSLLARALANQGKLVDALAWSDQWIAADKVDPAAHYLRATIQQELGELDAARGSLRRAIYLQPDFALAHFALGNLARADARSAESTKHFSNAQYLLRSRPPGELLPESDGMTAGRLTEIITTLLSLPHQSLVSQEAFSND